MKTALVLGGADCLGEDLRKYLVTPDLSYQGVVACNEAGIWFPGNLNAWVSLHPRFFVTKMWREKRSDKGRPAALRYFGNPEAKRIQRGANLTPDIEFTDYRFPGQEKCGSSGLFAAKVALIDLGFDRVVFCGTPMMRTPHFYRKDKNPWEPAQEFFEQWATIEKPYLSRMRSMSGRTKDFLGLPESEWLNDL